MDLTTPVLTARGGTSRSVHAGDPMLLVEPSTSKNIRTVDPVPNMFGDQYWGTFGLGKFVNMIFQKMPKNTKHVEEQVVYQLASCTIYSVATYSGHAVVFCHHSPQNVFQCSFGRVQFLLHIDSLLHISKHIDWARADFLRRNVPQFLASMRVDMW